MVSSDYGEPYRINLAGTELEKTAATGGFILTEVNQGKTIRIGKDTLSYLDNLGINFYVCLTSEEEYIKIKGYLINCSNSDGCFKLEYRLPVKMDGMFWGNNITAPRKIDEDIVYINASDFSDTHKVSSYPFSCIHNADNGLALAVPMDAISVFRLYYNNTLDEGYYAAAFDFGLSGSDQDGSQRFDFTIIVYTHSGDYGFRRCAEKYYEIFPHYFERRVEEAGNWIFNQNYSDVLNLEDFCFKYNETPYDYIQDKETGITSFKYIAPSEKWIGFPERERDPEPTYGEFVERLNSNCNLDDSVLDFDLLPEKLCSEAVLNSAILMENGKYRTEGWYVYGPMVNFVVNGDPDIEGINFAQTRLMGIEKSQKRALDAGYRIGGIYIDNLNWCSGIMNYREEHFKFSGMPLLWDKEFRLALPVAFTQFKYVNYFRDYANKNDMLILANFAFPELGPVHYINVVDIPGGEIGDGWGDSDEEFAIRRTLAYRKPWVLLLTQHLPYGKTVHLSFQQREQLMRKSLVFGIYVNILGLGISKPEEFDKYRPLFKKYIPIVNELDKAGWQPITYAKVRNKADIIIERYGRSEDNILFALYNNGISDDVEICIDCEALKINGSVTAVDMFSNNLISTNRIYENHIILYLHIEGGDCAAIRLLRG